MTDFTTRMTTLLVRLRRERNGLTAEQIDRALSPSLRYGLNLGVSLPTIRLIARAERPDHDFARFLYRQQVRELRLAALWIAEPDRVTGEELSLWMEGRMPVELLEELAFALLSRTKVLPNLLSWLEHADRNYAYAAAMALARGEEYDREKAVQGVWRGVLAHPDDLLFARGAAVLLTRLNDYADSRTSVRHLLDSLGDTPAESLLGEELAWRLAN